MNRACRDAGAIFTSGVNLPAHVPPYLPASVVKAIAEYVDGSLYERYLAGLAPETLEEALKGMWEKFKVKRDKSLG